MAKFSGNFSCFKNFRTYCTLHLNQIVWVVGGYVCKEEIRGILCNPMYQRR